MDAHLCAWAVCRAANSPAQLFAAALRDTLPRLQKLRHEADYATYQVTETEATRAFRRGQAFVRAIQEGRGGERR
jgi:uncharacterized protein (UPF0332 family)